MPQACFRSGPAALRKDGGIGRAGLVRRLRSGGTPFVAIIRVDNASHQRMPHHVGIAEMVKGYAAHAAQHGKGMHKPRSGFPFPLSLPQHGAVHGRQIDLRHISGDNRTGAEPQTGEKHLHLLAGGVLGFIQNEKGVVERVRPRMKASGATSMIPVS